MNQGQRWTSLLVGAVVALALTSCSKLQVLPPGGGAGASGSGATSGGAGGSGVAGSGAAGSGGQLDAPIADAGMDQDPGQLANACVSGAHSCAGACVSNDDPNTCGSACTPCNAPAGGTATCDGTSCGASCPTGKTLCQGACVSPDSAQACGTCPSGTHACSGLCLAPDDEHGCGTSCTPCAVPSGATQATCDGTSCGFVCAAGYHKCGSRCVRDDDTTACGGACQACSGVANGTATCVGGTCGIACGSGTHACNGLCVDSTDPATCGGSCTACPAPTGGSSSCLQGQCGATCPSGKILCNGVCIASGQACSGTCPDGTHNCSGLCAADINQNSCGTSCTSCPVPVGASQATCDGTSCGLLCAAGYHSCGTTCAADDASNACGLSCAVCPSDPNGTPVCQSGVCGLNCKSGFHACNHQCVSNGDLASCGATSCDACTSPSGGSVACNGISCVASCPSDQQLCNGACIPKTDVCGGCPATAHNCSGVCKANGDSNSCGARCSACPIPAANGQPSCDGTNCGIQCDSGYRNCAQTSLCVAASGGCCGNGDCTAGPTGTVGTCSGSTCSYPCNTPTYKQCGAACILAGACCTNADCGAAKSCNSSNACVDIVCSGDSDCGSGYYCSNNACRPKCSKTTDCNTGEYCAATRCIPQLPAGSTCTTTDQCSTAVCSGGVCCKAACGANQMCNGTGDCVCVGNTHTCSGMSGCFADSVSTCGATCMSCPAVTNGTTQCQTGGVCSATCSTGYMRCDGSPKTCVVSSWSFEDGGIDGWQFLSTVNPAYDGSSVTTTRPAPGAGSYSVQIASDFTCTRRAYELALNLCGSGSSTGVDLRGKTFSFKYYFDGAAIPPDSGISDNQVAAGAYTSSSTLTGTLQTIVANQWTTVSLPLDSTASSTYLLKASFYLLPHGPSPGNVCLEWKGNVYLDAFSVN